MITVSIKINRSIRLVWKFFTTPQNWKKWYGGNLTGISPGWEKNARLFWDLGESSSIVELIPEQEIKISAQWLDVTYQFIPAGQDNTIIKIIESDPKNGAFFTDGGEANHIEWQKKLSALKECIEKETEFTVSSEENSTKLEPQLNEALSPSLQKKNFRHSIRSLLIGIVVLGLTLLAGRIVFTSLGLRPWMNATVTLSPTSTAVPSATVPPTLTATPTLAATATPTPLPAGSIRITKTDGMKLVYIPEGNFLMGATQNQVSKIIQNCVDNNNPRADCELWYSDQLPQHGVKLDAYWIDQTVITNRLYARCVSAKECTEPRDKSSSTRQNYYDSSEFADYPVINITWNQANGYCKWAERRLPTEAEWEKAARGNDGRTYPWGEGIDRALANYYGKDTSKIGDYPSNISPYGAKEMAGNVWQWISDWYDYDYYKSQTSWSNPKGPEYGEEKMFRGGSWMQNALGVMATFRASDNPNQFSNNLGFRCAISDADLKMDRIASSAAGEPIATPSLKPTNIPDDPSRKYVIAPNTFNLDTPRACNSDVKITGVQGSQFQLNVTRLSIVNGQTVFWCPGALHTWIGKLSFQGYTFISDTDDPLLFKVNSDGGYQYMKGKGSVIQPDGKQISFP